MRESKRGQERTDSNDEEGTRRSHERIGGVYGNFFSLRKGPLHAFRLFPWHDHLLATFCP